MSHTIRLHRVLCAPADRIYRAFITPEALGKWLPPHGFVCAVHELKPVSCGMAVSIVQEGVPEVIPEEGCYVGWQQSLQLLALLVEAEIPG